MAHFVKMKPGGWSNGDTIAKDEIELLDRQLFGALNGDDGGSWAPTSPIIIGGAGIDFTLAACPEGDEVDPYRDPAMRPRRGWCQYGAPATFQRATMLMPRVLVPGGGVDSEWNVMGQGMGPAARVAFRNQDVPHATRLDSVRLTFAIVGGHVDKPQLQLGLAVYRTNLQTGVHEALSSVVDPIYGPGVLLATAPNVGAYSALTQLDYPTSFPANMIDNSQYSYGALIIDEQGQFAMGGNVFFGLRTTFTAWEFRPE